MSRIRRDEIHTEIAIETALQSQLKNLIVIELFLPLVFYDR